MNAKTVVEAFYAAIDTGDMARAESYMTDQFTFSGPIPQPVGKTQFWSLMDALLAGMPDLKLNAKNIKAQDSKVTLTVQLTGTHTATLDRLGPGMPAVPATGKRVTLPEERITITVRDDKLASLEVASVPGGGVSGILAQLGAARSA